MYLEENIRGTLQEGFIPFLQKGMNCTPKSKQRTPEDSQ